ncbi:MAG: LacI family DNA-binding transcriptional regulator [Bacteroidales bacterium]|nr:LacI family DNA-binding transcriptional regulator [Bacteroidales bacterium]
MKPYKKISLNDIAEKLGVSKTLVSMVLNGKGDENGISKSTQERVIQLAQELNYKPNQFARGLRLGKSNTIGLIVSDISNSFYARIARYVEDYCSQNEYNLIICNSDENPEKEKKIIKTLLEKQVDGLIISSTIEDTEHLSMLNNEEIPFILIDRIYSSFPSNYVIVNNFLGAKEATQHIIENGHKKIACYTISPAHISTQVERFLGFKAALDESFITFNEFYYKVIPRENIYQSIYTTIKEWHYNHIMPTAIFLANNQLTLALIEICREFRINVPKDLSIVSFDDIEVFRFNNPPITGVVQPIESIAHSAVNELVKIIRQSKNEKTIHLAQIKLETNLVIRSSVAKYL